MGIINELYQAVNSEYRELTIKLFSDGSLGFYIWETEFPVAYDRETKKAFIETELLENTITSDMMEELANVMKIIESNVDEIENWFKE